MHTPAGPVKTPVPAFKLLHGMWRKLIVVVIDGDGNSGEPDS
jgi:hypothetical protein